MAYEWQAQRLGDFIRAERQKRGLSLRQLGTAAKVPFTWISQVENGGIESPDPENLGRIALEMEINLADLFIEAGYPAAAPAALPSVRPYLRTKYGMPDAAAAEVERYINIINARDKRRKEGEDER